MDIGPDRGGDQGARDETWAHNQPILPIIYAVLRISLTHRAVFSVKLNPIWLAGMEINFFPEFYFGAITRTTRTA